MAVCGPPGFSGSFTFGQGATGHYNRVAGVCARVARSVALAVSGEVPHGAKSPYVAAVRRATVR